MALILNCDCCGKELKKTGALVFGIPKKNRPLKYHVCRKCFRKKILPLLIQPSSRCNLDECP